MCCARARAQYGGQRFFFAEPSIATRATNVADGDDEAEDDDEEVEVQHPFMKILAELDDAYLPVEEAIDTDVGIGSVVFLVANTVAVRVSPPHDNARACERVER